MALITNASTKFKKMKMGNITTILVDNGTHHCHNVGDLAMLMVTVRRLERKIPGVKVKVFTGSVERLKFFVPSGTPVSIKGRGLWFMTWNIFGGLHRVIPKALHGWLELCENKLRVFSPYLSYKWISYRLAKRGYDIRALEQFVDDMKSSDVVIASGGGYITDHFEAHASKLLQVLVLANRLKKPTALFGQGLGPVNSKELLYWLGRTLRFLKTLTLREGLYTKPLAMSLAGKGYITGDDAIQLAFEHMPRKLGGALGVNIRVANYSGISDRSVSSLRSALAKSTRLCKAKMLPVPISIMGEDSDFSSLELLLDRKILEDEKEKLSSPEKVICQVGKCRVVVTGSYHAAVFALSQGVSVVAVVASEYYSHKFEGLANQFTKGCYIVKQGEGGLEERLAGTIQTAWLEADNVRDHLCDKAKEQIDKAERGYDEFIASLDSDLR